MKNLLFLMLLIPVLAQADQRIEREYGVGTTVEFELYAADGTLSISEVDSGTEVTIVCDGDAGTTATNDFVDEGFAYSLVLTAAEMQCAHTTLNIGATLNHAVIIETFGNASAAISSYGAGLNDPTAAAIAAAVMAATCEDQGAGLTVQECLSILLAEASGTAVYTSGTRTWVVSDPSGTETRINMVYGAELDGDRSTSTLTPMTP